MCLFFSEMSLFPHTAPYKDKAMDVFCQPVSLKKKVMQKICPSSITEITLHFLGNQ